MVDPPRPFHPPRPLPLLDPGGLPSDPSPRRYPWAQSDTTCDFLQMNHSFSITTHELTFCLSSSSCNPLVELITLIAVTTLCAVCSVCSAHRGRYELLHRLHRLLTSIPPTACISSFWAEHAEKLFLDVHSPVNPSVSTIWTLRGDFFISFIFFDGVLYRNSLFLLLSTLEHLQ